MQRFAVILFALVALFAVVVPSSASILSQVKRETNGDRFARGLPPLPPSRRETAKRTQNSHPSVPQTGRIQVRDHGNGQSLGYVQNGPTGPHGINLGTDPECRDLNVFYNPWEKTIFGLGAVFGKTGTGGSYFGGLVTPEILSGSSLAYVPLQNVDISKATDEADIWSIGPDGQLIALWTNIDSSIITVGYVYNSVTNQLYLVGDAAGFVSAFSSWDIVDLFLIH